MAWSGRNLAITHSAYLAVQSLLGDRQAELITYPLCQIDQPPTNDPMRRRYRPGLHDLDQCTALVVIQDRSLARCFVGDKPIRPFGVKAQDPISHTLQVNTAGPGRIAPSAAIARDSKRRT